MQNTQMYYAVEKCGNEYLLNETIGRDVRTRKFRHLHLRHFVRLPHHYHSLENSTTFQDLALKFPGLSRTKPILQDFPGPGNCTQKKPGHSRFQERGKPVVSSSMTMQGLTSHQHIIGHIWNGFYRSNDPTNSVKALKEDRSKD